MFSAVFTHLIVPSWPNRIRDVATVRPMVATRMICPAALAECRSPLTRVDRMVLETGTTWIDHSPASVVSVADVPIKTSSVRHGVRLSLFRSC